MTTPIKNTKVCVYINGSIEWDFYRMGKLNGGIMVYDRNLAEEVRDILKDALKQCEEQLLTVKL